MYYYGTSLFRPWWRAVYEVIRMYIHSASICVRNSWGGGEGELLRSIWATTRPNPAMSSTNLGACHEKTQLAMYVTHTWQLLLPLLHKYGLSFFLSLVLLEVVVLLSVLRTDLTGEGSNSVWLRAGKKESEREEGGGRRLPARQERWRTSGFG